MTNIAQLKREETAARVTGSHYGSDKLPMRQDDLRAMNVCPHGLPECERFFARPNVCGNEVAE